MPTVTVARDLLFQYLQKSFSQHEFEDLCFDFGIELDDVTSEKEIAAKGEKSVANNANLSEEVLYKIEVPANRYDLLCAEGLTTALRVFKFDQPAPTFKVVQPENPIKIFQKASTREVRPYIVGALLRGVKLDAAKYDSLMDLQDKLHQNIGRKRTLVAIGTHDYDTIKGPFYYDAKPQKDIRFVPLMENREFDVASLFHYYKNEKPNCHLKPYLHITENAANHPVIYDSQGTVLSLPPIINGEHSKITLNTRNIFIECTGTDWTKLNITLNTICAMFSQYCTEPFTIEGVQVIQEDGSDLAGKLAQLRINDFVTGATDKTVFTPDMKERTFLADPARLNQDVGITPPIPAPELAKLLSKMQMPTVYDEQKQQLVVSVPCVRSDVIHVCDIVEDVAIAYGYNKLIRTIPNCTTIGRAFPLNKLSDALRDVVAQNGFSEVLTWALLSHDENFKMLNKNDNNDEAVILSNPKTRDFEVARTSLLPGILKALSSNKGLMKLPVRLFEVGDVVLLDPSRDVGAKNQRRLAALYCDTVSGFEVMHGLVDRIMVMNNIPFEPTVRHLSTIQRSYSIKKSESSTLLPSRRADVFVKEQKVGSFGILHPDVLAAFELPFPCSMLEINLETFL